MSDGLLSALIQLVLSLGGSAVVVQLLTLRQNRRRIAGDASTAEANAASTLSGAALQLVESARQDVRVAKDEAAHAKAETEALRRDLEDAKWRIDALERRERDLEDAMRAQGIQPPPRRRDYDNPRHAVTDALFDLDEDRA